MSGPSQETIAAEILKQVAAREGSICPSEVARALAQEWRPLMTPVRTAAMALVEAGYIDILRKGRPVPLQEVRGVIRLRRRES